MARHVEDASIDLARNRIATLALSMYQIHGLPAPSSDELGNLVSSAEASMSGHQLRNPDSISTSAIGQIDQLVLSTAEAKQRSTNIYSADAARSAQAGDSGVAGIKRSDLDPLNLSLSSARFRDIDAAGRHGGLNVSAFGGDILKTSADTDWSSPAGLAKMREYALKSGLPWAANNPELLRLGPAAIGALAAVQLKQETYKSLTTDASFKAKDVVTLARFAKEHQVDANTLGSSLATVEKGLTPEEKAKINGAVIPYMADSKNPERQKAATKAFDEVERAHPEKHQAIEKVRENLQLKREKLEHANDAAASKNIKAEGKADAFNSLEEPSQSSPKLSKDEKAKPEAKPSAPQPVRVSATRTDTPKIAAPKPG